MHTSSRNCPICNDNQVSRFANVDGFWVVRCQNCEFVFVDIDEATCNEANVYPEQKLQTYYSYEPVYTLAYYDAIIDTMQNQSLTSKLRILDFGCGAGMFMRRARARGHDVHGVDFSPYSAAASTMFGLNIHNVDIANCTFDLESFDVIISHATYEHLFNPLSITNDLLKFLKPDGLFVITGVPNFNSIQIQWFKNFYCNGLGHVNHYNPASLRRLFVESGLAPIKIRGYGVPIWWLLDRIYTIRSGSVTTNPEVASEKTDSKNLIALYDTYKPTRFERFVSWLYTNAPPSFISLSLEAWGRKMP
jgi:SAM-dependent methyltransferase